MSEIEADSDSSERNDPDLDRDDEDEEEELYGDPGDDDAIDNTFPADFEAEEDILFNPHDALKVASTEIQFNTAPTKRWAYLTKYEYTKVRGIRLHQLEQGYPTYLDDDHDDLSFEQIFESELSQKKLPFIVVRQLGNQHSQYFRLRDLEYLGEG